MTPTNNNGFLAGSNLERILKAGHFAVTGELGPPQSADGQEIRHKAQLLKGNCDAVNITDNQTAIVRMSSIGAGTIVVQEGLEPIIQMTCRDRNRLAIQSDLLGAYALGMRNLLALTGDHQKFGNHPTAKNVFDMDSVQLVRTVAQMRDEGIFECGEVFKGQEPRFFVGAAAAPFADPLDFRPYRLAKKVQAGADFIQTQLIYDVPAFKKYMEKVRELGVHEKTQLVLDLVGKDCRQKCCVTDLDTFYELREQSRPGFGGTGSEVEIVSRSRNHGGVGGSPVEPGVVRTPHAEYEEHINTMVACSPEEIQHICHIDGG